MESQPKNVSFDNLENAFASKTNAEIEQAYWLFKAIENPKLVKTGSGLTEWALKYHLPIKGIIKGTIFKQFCGGETIDECTKTIEKLGKYGVGSILDYSVEGKEEENEFDHSCEEIISTIRRAKGDKNIPFSVFKVTGLGRYDLLEKVSAGSNLSSEESAEYSHVKKRVQKICEEGFKLNVRVFIDAEESWVQQAIDDLATENMVTFNKEKAIIYNTIQLYRHDRLSFLKVSYEKAVNGNYHLGLKLVRGAYMEKERERAKTKGYPSPIQPDKSSSDRDYNEALRFCVDHLDRIAICAGTHNEESSLLLTKMMNEKGIDPRTDRIFFSQLLGMSDHISFNLAKAGFKVAKYVPYGPVNAVFPYLTRRAQENTSMAGQTGRELNLLMAEKKRRKQK
jgi:proline dehydrogenase